MNVYIYDSYVNQKRFDSSIIKIETRITDLGLNGKIIRLGVMSSLYNSIENEIKKGAKSIIAVGNNLILNQVINTVAEINSTNISHKETPVGFIPIGKKNNDIADYLGIGPEEKACNTLSARRIQKLDLGLINDSYYFLTQATITTQNTSLEIDKNYSIEIKEKGEVGVINLPTTTVLPQEINSNAQDNTLELYIKTKNSKKFLPLGLKTNESFFSFKKLKIINPKHQILVDGIVKIPTPATITIAKEKINLIVGKNRNF